MMNRIILIGNGFDLAHGLPTSYRDFIKSYWQTRMKNLNLCDSKKSHDELSQFNLQFPNHLHSISYPPTIKAFLQYYRYSVISLGNIDTINAASPDGNLKFSYSNQFFRIINNDLGTKNWVDIENAYYKQLKKIVQKENLIYNEPQKLDSEFEIIKAHLVSYLMKIQDKHINYGLRKDCIFTTLFEPFIPQDISNEGSHAFKDYLITRLNYIAQNNEQNINCFLLQFGTSVSFCRSAMNQYKEFIKDTSAPNSLDILKHVERVYENNVDVPAVYLLPNQILFLNFNYTSTADLYIPEGSDFKVNHIHGELGNDKNPIIFGYGDELDDDYKEISKLNDNDYLKNIKSIRYLETDNYRKLLSFIDSAPFQIYIMGHSCGNSDRTLLNTLFEHKNCVSIKPFYHQREDGSDNYIEIIQNISRNFNDMRLMRDRVVNKTYCRPLVGPKK